MLLDLEEIENGFAIRIDNYPLIRHLTSDPLITVGISRSDFSLDHGMFDIKEKVQEKFPLVDFTIVERLNDRIVVNFYTRDRLIELQLVITEENNIVEMVIDTDHSYLNRFWISLLATDKEAIYGCGEQYSEVNLRGKKIPLWCQEQGIGRGDPVIFTFLANLLKNAGGNKFTTYYPQPTFVSSNNYFCHIHTTCYSEFNFQDNAKHELYVWEIPHKISLGKYDSGLQTLEFLSYILGRQPRLPEWLLEGIILGIQGGTDVILQKLTLCEQYGVRVAGVWAQDWEGKRLTSFGKQLFWDWKFDPELYPNLPAVIQQLHNRGIRFLGYINTFLALEGELYKEASANGYLVKNPQGEEYYVTITDFPAAILDLTNPETVSWIKQVIKQNMLGIGMDGWMADFGEYLPTDAVLHSGINAEHYHNQYPVEWAKINREVLEETNNLDKVVFFTRAGFSHTSKYSPLIWAGDQLVTWSVHDGLASVIPAGISLGICGIGNYHYDIGGYTTIRKFKRSKEVFMRWAEAAAFTMAMRTHEGNRPEENWQFDSDEETLTHLSKMTRIHTTLKPYLKTLAVEYDKKGYPPIRACYLHYPEDPVVHTLKYQYLLGQDLLVAPVTKKGKNQWKVYLPDDSWVHLWTGQQYTGGQWITIDAPLGSPPVFYRLESKFINLFGSLSRF